MMREFDIANMISTNENMTQHLQKKKDIIFYFIFNEPLKMRTIVILFIRHV
jgi:hypothetical protein